MGLSIEECENKENGKNANDPACLALRGEVSWDCPEKVELGEGVEGLRPT